MNETKRRNFFIILILGALSTISPISIDMYLPAFSQIAGELNTTAGKVSLSLSSYFIGLSLGQIFYGPLLDRFGRKKPLYVGLILFVFASLGCLLARSVESLIVFRFIQALGGCAGQVAAMSMVRDFFPVKESAKVFSLLILILGVSPLLAPSIGSFVTLHFGWQAIFIILSIAVTAITLVVLFFLPEGHTPDPTVSLDFKSLIQNFTSIFQNPQFATYSLAGAYSFAALFVYVVGSPIIFMDIFQVSAQKYALIFACLSVGFIGASQVNIFLTRKYSSQQIFSCAIIMQVIVSLVFLLGSFAIGFGLYATIIFIFLMLACLGIASPNASAIALAPFSKNVGSASALLGSLQIGVAALVSSGVGIFEVGHSTTFASLMAIPPAIGLIIFIFGKKRIIHLEVGDDEEITRLAL